MNRGTLGIRDTEEPIRDIDPTQDTGRHDHLTGHPMVRHAHPTGHHDHLTGHHARLTEHPMEHHARLTEHPMVRLTMQGGVLPAMN